MGWGSQRNANKRPIVVCFTRINLLTIHLFQVFLGQRLCHFLQYLLLSALLWQHNSNHEFGLDAEPKNAIDVSSDDLQMHKSREHFLELI